MKKSKIYSTNVSGKNIIVKAYSARQIADWAGVTLYSLRPFLSVCGPAVREIDVDLTAEEWPD